MEGIFDHHLLGIHHVNETVPREQWIYWDLGFLAWGAAMLMGGWFTLKRGAARRGIRHHTPPPEWLTSRINRGVTCKRP